MDNKYVTYNIENGVAPTKPLIKNIGFITAFEANYSTDFYFKGEYHDFWEIVVVLSGNIGVTTSQQMLQSELDIARWNLYEHIADLFCSEFCIMVY